MNAGGGSGNGGLLFASLAPGFHPGVELARDALAKEHDHQNEHEALDDQHPFCERGQVVLHRHDEHDIALWFCLLNKLNAGPELIKLIIFSYLLR